MTQVIINETGIEVISVGTQGPPGASSPPGGTSGQIQYNNAGAFGGVTAVAIAHGGTGQVTATAATNALLPSQATNSGKVLTTDGTNTSWATGGGGSPGGTSGQIQYNNSGAFGGGTAVPIANGGTGQVTATLATNALLPSQATNSGKVLTTDGTNTSWATAGGGGSPAGSDTQVQFNDGGSFGANGFFVYDKTARKVTVSDSGRVAILNDGSSAGSFTPDGSKFALLGPSSYAAQFTDGTNTLYCCNTAYAFAATGPCIINGQFWTNQTSFGTTLGSVTQKLPIYDGTGTLLGYVPVYDTIG